MRRQKQNRKQEQTRLETQYYPAFNITKAFELPKGLVIYDRPPALGGKSTPFSPDDFKWCNTILVPDIKHKGEIPDKFSCAPGDPDPDKTCNDFLKLLQEQTASTKLMLANMDLDPKRKKLGKGIFYSAKIKPGDFLCLVTGRFHRAPVYATDPKEREYSQTISPQGDWISFDKERSYYGYFQHLPKKESLQKLAFYPPELVDKVQTQNIKVKLAYAECGSEVYPMQLCYAADDKDSVGYGRPTGYDYGDDYWRIRDDTYPAKVDEKGRIIPPALYYGDLIPLRIPHSKIEVSNSKLESIKHIDVNFDRKSLIAIIKKKGDKEPTPTPTITSSQFGVSLNPDELRARLTTRGYIPTKPENLSSDLEADFVRAAAEGDFSTIEYLLEWHELQFTNINCMPATASGTALHSAVSHGHLYLVQYLLINGADPMKRDANGHTAYDLAIRLEDDREIYNCLRNHLFREYFYKSQEPDEKAEKLSSTPPEPKKECDTGGCFHYSMEAPDGKPFDLCPPTSPIYKQSIDLEVAKKYYIAKVETTLNELTQPLVPGKSWKCNGSKALIKLADEEEQKKILDLFKNYPQISIEAKTSTGVKQTIYTLTISDPDVAALMAISQAAKKLSGSVGTPTLFTDTTAPGTTIFSHATHTAQSATEPAAQPSSANTLAALSTVLAPAAPS